MNNDPSLMRLRAMMKEFKNNLYAIVRRNVVRAPLAYVSKALEGRTPSQAISELSNIVNAHINTRGENIHGDKPEDLDMYPAEYMDNWILQAVHRGRYHPINYYGDREYLPPDVSGTYGNATNPLPYSNVAMLMEDTGTLVILRPGTDGSERDVYYSYIKNASNSFSLSNWTVTAQPYRPAFLPANSKVHAILHCGRESIVGVVANKSNVPTGYFVAITNRTLDQTKHSGVFIPNGGFMNIPFDDAQEVAVGSLVMQGHVYVFLSTFNGKTGSSRGTMGWVVYRIPIADIVEGTFKSATRVTGWTINRGSGGQVSRNDLILADTPTAVCTVASSVTYTPRPKPNSVEGFWAVPVSETVQRITWCQNLSFRSNVNGLTYSQAFVFSLEFNPSSKIIDVSSYYNQKTSVSAYPGVNFSSSPAVTKTSVRNAMTGFKNVCVLADPDDTTLWMYTVATDTSQDARLYRYTNHNGSELYSWVSGYQHPSGATSFLSIVQPGGPLGTNFHSLSCYSDDSMSTLTLTKRSKDAAPEWAFVRCTLQGTPTYQHKSVTGKYARPGFPPGDFRYFLNSPGGSNQAARNYAHQLSEVSGGNHSVHGGVFHNFSTSGNYWGTMLSRPGNISSSGGVSGSISVSSAAMHQIRQLVIEEYDLAGYKPRPGTEPVLVSLYMPQISNIPPFVYGVYIAENGHASWYVYSLLLPKGTPPNQLGPVSSIRLRVPREKDRQEDLKIKFDEDTAAYEAYLIALDEWKNQVPVEGVPPLPKPEEVEKPRPLYVYPDDWRIEALTESINMDGAGPWLGTTYLQDFCSQAAIRQVPGGYVVVIPQNGFIDDTAGATSIISELRYTTDGAWTSIDKMRYMVTGSPVGVMNFPTRGMYVVMSSENQFGNVDHSTKLMGKLWCNGSWPGESLQQAVEGLGRGNTGIVVISQQVSSAWVLYFNETQSAMQDGIFVTLPVYRHYFNASTDANKTFNVWVARVAYGSPVYRVLPVGEVPFSVEVPDDFSTSQMLIGTVKTDNLGISEIDIKKTVGLGAYTLTSESRKTAIPVAAGSPIDPTPLSWR